MTWCSNHPYLFDRWNAWENISVAWGFAEYCYKSRSAVEMLGDSDFFCWRHPVNPRHPNQMPSLEVFDWYVFRVQVPPQFRWDWMSSSSKWPNLMFFKWRSLDHLFQGHLKHPKRGHWEETWWLYSIILHGFKQHPRFEPLDFWESNPKSYWQRLGYLVVLVCIQ